MGVSPLCAASFNLATSDTDSAYPDRAVVEIFRRAGHDVEVHPNRLELGLRDANDGYFDGQVAAPAHLSKRGYSKLVPVPEALFDYELVALSHNPDIRIESWEDLKGYRVGYTTPLFFQGLDGYPLDEWLPMRDVTTLLDGVNSGAIDVLLSGQIKVPGSHNHYPMHQVSPPLLVLPAYIQLHAKHAELLDQLAGIIREMKADASLERILATGKVNPDNPIKKVLHLHTFHPNQIWELDMMRGSAEVFPLSHFMVYHEFMDSRRLRTGKELWAPFYQRLRSVYAIEDIDIILTSDTDAFLFLRRYYSHFRPGIPVVFQSLNDYTPDLVENFPVMTGIVEMLSPQETLRLAMQLRPKATRVLLVTSTIDEDAQLKELLSTQLQEMPEVQSGRMAAEIVSALDIDGIYERIRNLKGDTIVILGLCYDGNRDEEECVKLLAHAARESKTPLFGLYGDYQAYGLAGGKLASSYSQAKAAGGIAKRILSGTAPADIPVNFYGEANSWAFNLTELQQAGISERQLTHALKEIGVPLSDVQMTDRIASFYDLYTPQIWSGIIIGIIALLTIFLLFRYSKKLAVLNNDLRQTARSLDEQNAARATLMTELADRVQTILGAVRIPDKDDAAAAEPAMAAGTDAADLENFKLGMRKTFNALASHMTWFKSITDSTSMATLITDLDTKVLYANKAATDLIGRPLEAIVGTPCEDNWPNVHEAIQCLKTQMPTKAYCAENKRWYLSRPSWLRDSDGRNIGYIIANEDITDIHRKDEFAQLLLQSSPICAHIFDANTKEIIDCNDKAYQLFDAPSKEEYLAHFEEYHVSNQNGTAMDDLFHEKFNLAVEQGSAEFDWIGQTRKKEPIPMHVFFRAAHVEGDPIILAHGVDMRSLLAAESRAERSEQQMLQTFNTLSAALAVFEAIRDEAGTLVDFRLSQVNAAWTTMFCKDGENPLGQRLSAIFPDDGTLWLDSWTRVLANQKSETVEVLNRANNRWERVASFAPGGDRIMTITDDITSRVQEEAALKKEKERLSWILETAPLSFCVLENGLLVDANRYATDQVGYQLHQPMSRRFVDDNERSDLMETLRETGRALNQTLSIRMADNSVRQFLINASMTRENENITAIFWGLDIEEIRRTRDHLRLLTEDLERILDSLPLPVVLGDPDSTTFMYCNQAFRTLLGYSSAKDIIGKTIWELSPEDQPLSEKEMPAIGKFVKPGSLSEFNWVFQRSNGTPVDTHVVAGFVTYRGRHAFVANCRDVTQERAQQALLKEAADAAEAANQLKSYFLANMSHEIRTPMNAIIGLSRVEMDRDPDPRRAGNFKKIHDSARILLSIINDILDFSKIEAGKLELEDIEFSLDQTITEAMRVTTPHLAGKRLEILYLPSPHLPSLCLGDPTRIWQVLKNILDNAARFTEQGEIILQADASPARQLGENMVMLTFAIRDTGIGMSPDRLNHIFKPFEQADGSTTRRYGGTGLGLSITRNLVQLMGGSIDVESELGKGTCFTLRIPIRQIPVKEDTPSTKSDFKMIRALVVDDNATARVALSQMLTELGATVRTAASGAEALEMIHARDNTEPFNLLLLDYLMDDMDGIALSKKIADSQLANTPRLLMVTAYARDIVEDQLFGSHILDILDKPVSPSVLSEKLLEIFDLVQHTAQEKTVMKVNARILLVEDNPFNQEVASAMLEPFGVEVVIAENGAEAVEKSKTEDFDIVLMDIQMPVMDGYTAVKNIRARNSKWATAVPIIAMTAHAMKEDEQRSMEAGMNGHLAKPIMPEDLERILQKYLTHKVEYIVPTAEITTDDGPALPTFTTVDTEAGLQRMMGNKATYSLLLSDFYLHNKTFVTDLENAFQSNDMTLVKRMVHTIKGASGAICANQLFETATAVDKELKGDIPHNEVPKLLERVVKAINPLLRELQPFSEAYQLHHGVRYNDNPLDKEATGAAIEKLMPLLRSFDMDAETAFQAFAKLDGLAPYKELIEILATQIKNFDFGNAEKTLTDLKTSIGL